MSIEFNDFSLEWSKIHSLVSSAVCRVGKSGQYILGKEVKSFEKRLAKFWKKSYAVGCGNGLDAIEISLRCLGLKPGTQVLTTPLSAFATTLAILRAGGVPVFVDVDNSGLIDLELADRIFQKYQDIRFMVPVHLYGHALDLKKLKSLKRRYHLKIVEDCAQSIGSKNTGVNTGSVGQTAATSFYPTKNLGCLGDGGAILTNNFIFAKKAKALRNYGQTSKYCHKHLGLNSRLDEIQAAILKDAFLPKLTAQIKKRRQIAKQYLQEIKNKKLAIPPKPIGSNSSWHLFPIIVKNDRDSFQKHMSANNIATLIHYPRLIPNQPVLKTKVKILTSLAKASFFAQRVVSLPIHPSLNSSQIDIIITTCNSWKG